MKKGFVLLAVLLFLPSLATATLVAEVNPIQIKVLDKTYISNYIDWDFEPVNDTTWFTNFTIDYEFYKDAKAVFSTPSTHKKWQDFADNYFSDPDTLEDPNGVVIAEHVKNLWNMPRVSDNMSFTDIDFNMNDGSGTFYLTIAEARVGMYAEFGFGTATVATGGAGDQYYHGAFTNHIVYDPIFQQWIVGYIDSGSDIHLAYSTDNGTSWSDWGDVEVGTFDFEDFDMIATPGSDYTRIDFVFSDGDDQNCEHEAWWTTGAGSANANATDVMYSGGASDDCMFPDVSVDSNDCLVMSFTLEDDSEFTQSEMELWFVREGDTCGNGDVDEEDLDVTLEDMHGGEEYAHPSGAFSYGDLDFQILYGRPVADDQWSLEVKFFNGTSETIGNTYILDADVEGRWYSASAAYYANWAGVVVRDNFTGFACDDGTDDLDSFRVTSRKPSSDTQTDTSMNIDDATTGGIKVAVALDLNSTDADDILVFGINNADDEDIFIVNSTNGGSSWSTAELFIDEAATTNADWLYAEVWNCSALIIWQDGTDIESQTISTYGNCTAEGGAEPPADSCTYSSGDWSIDCSDYCQITSETNLGSNNLIMTGSGEVYTNAEVTFGSFVIGDGCNAVFGSSGKWVVS